MTFLTFILYFAQSQSNQSSTPDWGMYGVIVTILVGIGIDTAKLSPGAR